MVIFNNINLVCKIMGYCFKLLIINIFILKNMLKQSRFENIAIK